jgi:hypothetical protein
MKKALIVLLLLALVAGGLFAQISFWGRASTGLEVAIEDDTTFHIYNHPDRGGAGKYQFEFDASYTTANEKAGGYGGLDVTGGAISGWDANVWWKPVDVLKVVAGAGVYDWAWSTPGSLGDRNYTGDGVMLYLDPMAGLNIYAGILPKGAFGDTALSLGTRYTSSGVFQLVATLGYDGAANSGDGQVNAKAGVDILALAGMGVTKLAVDIGVDNITKLDTAGSFQVGPRINYNFAGFNGYVRANVRVPVTDEQKNQGMNLRAGVRGQYTVVPGITARLDAAYGLKGTIASTNGEPFNPYTGWGQVPYGFTTADTSVVGVQPAVVFNIDGKDLELGYGFLTQLGGAAKTKSAIYANFIVGF